MTKVGIIGAAGYTAGELIRILINHPETEIVSAVSESQVGKAISDIHRDLIGETDLVFQSDLGSDLDVVFICSGHGKSTAVIDSGIIPDGVKVIDLSRDYRLDGDHSFIYGLPELNKSLIKETNFIANPGCFATTIQLGLLPLAANGWLTDDVHVSAITGSTGAGQKPTEFTHFSWRNNNVSVYKAFTHQHLGEINQSLMSLQNDFGHSIHFIPIRGNFTRGILAASYIKTDVGLEEAKAAYESYYADAPFVHISTTNPDIKQVVNTNKCVIYLQKEGDQLLAISTLDNLVKGASGQAVQNMNLMFGLDETTGLNLKTVAF